MTPERMEELRALSLNGRQYPQEANVENLAYALSDAVQEISGLQIEIERLRGLLNDALFEVSSPGNFYCKWCNSDSFTKRIHRPGCPAFTPDGKVK